MTTEKINIGIIGLGWVGTPLKRYLEEHRGYRAGENLHTLDIIKEKCAGDIQKADIIFVTVPTPMRADGRCDLSIIEAVVSKIEPAAAGAQAGKIIVLKSTILPGTTEYFQKKHPEHKFLFNPEFLSERKAWLDFVKPDRQIVGFTEQSLDAAHQVLNLLPRAPFMSPWGIKTYDQTRITATEAEIIKYAGNIHGARKVNWANALAQVAEQMGASYDNVRAGLAADYRIGDSHLNVDNGGYRGFGGYCLAPEERLFIFNDDHYKIIVAKDLGEQAKSVLGWKDGRVIVDKIEAIGRRVVAELIRFGLAKGRSIAVTADHIVTVADRKGNLQEKVAREVNKNDLLPIVLDGFHSAERTLIKIYEEVDLTGYQVFAEKVPPALAFRLAPFLTPNQLRGFRRARHHSVPLEACRRAGIEIDSLRIKISKSGTWIPATIEVDKDFARLIGYYLAEGCVTDNRVLFTFGFHEKDLADDLKAILSALKIGYSERINYWQGRPSVLAIKVSSRILAGYFRKFGSSSREKTIPYFIFHSNQKIKDNILAGLLRGDGCLFKANTGNYWTVNFATVSQLLAEGVDALFREKGILASLKLIKTKKTKTPAWSLNVSEFRGVRELLPLFTERQRLKIKKLGGRNIKSPAYTRFKNLALLPIRAIETIRKRTEVVSVETVNHRYLSSWGILTHNCFPKDLSAFKQFAKDQGLSAVSDLLQSDWDFNEQLLSGQGLTIADVSKHIDDIKQVKSDTATLSDS